MSDLDWLKDRERFLEGYHAKTLPALLRWLARLL